ncbi:MAG: hypothetical protein L0K86_18290 [Actinomycetia bacterium]|nr:hypothetical protein [Actinomycetes bacterium]
MLPRTGSGGRSALARKGSHPIISFLVGFAVFMLISYALLSERFGLIFLVPAWIFVVLMWVGFSMHTTCGYETLQGSPCRRPARGKLQGCRAAHRQLKRDAMWASIGPWNPGLMLRVMWARQGATGGRRLRSRSPQPGRRSEDPPASRRRGSYDMSMWFLTAISAVAAVIALFMPK